MEDEMQNNNIINGETQPPVQGTVLMEPTASAWAPTASVVVPAGPASASFASVFQPQDGFQVMAQTPDPFSADALPRPTAAPVLSVAALALGESFIRQRQAEMEAEIEADVEIESLPFPSHRFPGFLPAFVKSAADSLGCDESMVAVPLLATLSGAIGNSCWVEVMPGWRMPGSLWAIVIAESGSGKTPALDAVAKPIRDLGVDFDEQFDKDMNRYREEKALFDVSRKKPQPGEVVPLYGPLKPVRRRIDFQDTTVEALASVLAANPRGGVLIADEARTWLGGFNQYKKGAGTDMEKWDEIWNGNTLRIDRKTGDEREIHVPRPFVSVTGGTQLSVFKSKINREAVDSGLLARILFCVPNRGSKDRNGLPIDRDLNRSLVNLYGQLAGMNVAKASEKHVPKYVKFSEDAQRRFDEWSKRYRAEAIKNLRPGVKYAMIKITGYVPRLALILQLVKDTLCPPAYDRNLPVAPDPEISVQTLEEAIQLGEWFGNEARLMYALVNIEKNEHEQSTDRILNYLRGQEDGVTVRDIQRATDDFNATQIRDHLEELVTSGLVTKEPVPTTGKGGRPTWKYKAAR
jgi:hypothetical protein